MINVGIDLGASRLRIATDQSGAPALLSHRFETERMSWLADSKKLAIENQASRYQVISLKRMLDFDREIPLTTGAMNSLDYLAKILRHVVADCGITRGNDSVNCVLAVPGSFSQRQRSALKTAAERAGFPCVKLVDDTTAALLASRDSVKDCSSVLVFALGAGSFSCALYRSNGNAFKIVAQEGDRHLGGDNIDSAILTHVFNVLQRDPRFIDHFNSAGFQARLLIECEKLKLEASAGQSLAMKAERLFHPHRPPNGLPAVLIPQDVFDESAKRLIVSAMALVEKLLRSKDAPPPDAALMVGGATKMSSLRLALQNRLRVPVHDANESAVACGAILYGKMLPPKEWEKEGSEEKDGVSHLEGRSERPSAAATDSHPVLPPTPPPPRSGWAELFLPSLISAEQLEQQGKLEESLRAFEAHLDKLNDFGAGLYRKVASARQTAGNKDGALQLLSEANRRSPKNKLVAADFAKTCYTQAAEFRKRRNLETALRIVSCGTEAIRRLPKPETEFPALMAQLIHLQACLKAEQGAPLEAAELLMECTKLAPSVKAYQEDLKTIRDTVKAGHKRPAPRAQPAVQQKIGRNDLCPCGSGKKYKKCCET